jgi:GH24 family phage-related lysozyme (muramidase)
MDLNKLRKQLEIDEGIKYEIYVDTLGKPTFGIGHLLTRNDIEYISYHNTKLGAKIKVSKDRVEQVFRKDIENCLLDCKIVFSDFSKFDEEIKQIIANMMFNLGINKFKKFRRFIRAIIDKNFKEAADEMMNSDWYFQVGNRAERLVARMENYADNYLCKVNIS